VVRKFINWLNFQTSGLQLNWTCPRGHDESDDTPLPRQAYCQTCDQLYSWQEIEQRGPLRQLPRVTAAEALS